MGRFLQSSVAALLLLDCAHRVHGAVEADRVHALPGFPASFPFTSYSGFLNVTANPKVSSLLT